MHIHTSYLCVAEKLPQVFKKAEIFFCTTVLFAMTLLKIIILLVDFYVLNYQSVFSGLGFYLLLSSDSWFYVFFWCCVLHRSLNRPQLKKRQHLRKIFPLVDLLPFAHYIGCQILDVKSFPKTVTLGSTGELDFFFCFTSAKSSDLLLSESSKTSVMSCLYSAHYQNSQLHLSGILES